MKIINNPPLPTNDSVTHTFKDGDLIAPNDNPRYCFRWRTGAILDPHHYYHVANSAERNYFWKHIFNGYKLMGAIDSYDYLDKNFNLYVINYKDL